MNQNDTLYHQNLLYLLNLIAVDDTFKQFFIEGVKSKRSAANKSLASDCTKKNKGKIQ